MAKFYPGICLLLSLFSFQMAWAQDLEVNYLSTYSTGIFDEGAAEIVAYDPGTQRLFFTNADAGTIDVLDISNPSIPTLIQQIDISAYGDGVNSVAVNNGLVAAAVENEVATAAGSVVFFDAAGNFLNQVTAGVLPDMVTFSPDGTKVLVANEGEPDDDYQIDPEGSVTIIDLSAGVEAASATQITFEAFNDQRVYLLNKGIRLFGPNATVAQDLEPEYIAVSADNTIAYVSLQENNGLAVIDIARASVLDILPLGYKDHLRGEPVLEEYLFNELSWWPTLGTPLYDNPAVELGGFSGLWFDPYTSTDDQLSFFVIPDRGPNEATVSRAAAGTSQNLRPFKLPDYQARVEKLILFKSTGNIYIDANPVYLTRKDGVTPISGRGNIPGFDEVPVTPTSDEVYTSTDYVVDGRSFHALEYDAFGGDFEGILRTPDRHFWMCDEYRPAIYHFDESGVLVERYVPEGTSLLGDEAQPEGYYGAETLPAVYSKRRPNRGFEAIAYDSDENIIYTFIQSPIENPDNRVRNNSDVIRILGIDPADGTPVREYVYLLERNRESGIGISRVDKIGDAVYAGNGKFLVLERDSSTPDDGDTGKKYVFEFTTKGATNILGTALSLKDAFSGENDKTLEMMTGDELAAAGIQPVAKTKVLNLPSIGYLPSDKPEGLAILPNGDLAVMNDNDFGLAGAGVSDNSSLGIISFQQNYGFDASDRDDEIEIVPRPTLGMYMPDAIASFSIDGKTYIATANEGDSRDYDGYSEELRVDDLVLDPDSYPNAADLQESENLGRLKTTAANGDVDGDGDVDQIYSYGARSFSILDENGNLIFDSGDEFERITAELLPDYFNSQGDDDRKNRSDDKGPEPESVTVKEIDGVYYAIIGLERIGGFMVYNVTDPHKAEYVTYFYNRDFSLAPEDDTTGDVAPEDLIVIDAADSPTGQTLLVSAAEVSGTISIFTLGESSSVRPIEDGIDVAAPAVASIDPVIYPNPVADYFNLDFAIEKETPVTISVFDQTGRRVLVRDYGQVQSGQHSLRFNAHNWPAGSYILQVRTARGQHTQQLLKVN
ncbi:choice-of-anchor I domain-containing protein [Flavilitoribacter nigricans]|uniref:Calcium-binding protein n=1 Tax=Flavilitoribacter nigricans (strain ATCC 23147 / DSM 23189 / NBRC 102662 / NCIMB 1420 / SS-2) TaxID=1122177 RepID=A0A2D0N5I1_FLAN2|nr:esterase-like activity of phytase family protein [Flavilitoribacter nigricans]PHN03792.1 calcium-binding protein [Flavilitoribacter nigricans DSM 23189 = NBRC 102662]